MEIYFRGQRGHTKYFVYLSLVCSYIKVVTCYNAGAHTCMCIVVHEHVCHSPQYFPLLNITGIPHPTHLHHIIQLLFICWENTKFGTPYGGGWHPPSLQHSSLSYTHNVHGLLPLWVSVDQTFRHRYAR